MTTRTRRILRLFRWLIYCLIAYQFWIFGHILWWRSHAPSTTPFMEEQSEALQATKPQAEIAYQWVEYEKISPNLKRAVIAAEDANFVGHDGFDWTGIQNAMEKNLKKGRIVAGGSTITQQLAKNLFLSSSRTPWRKIEEGLITVMLETALDKRRILLLYLNVVEWGEGVFGAEAAARHYHGRSAATLTSQQAATLASMLPRPRWFDKHRQSKGLLIKSGIISQRMGQVNVP